MFAVHKKCVLFRYGTSALNNEFLTNACNEWKDRLSDGLCLFVFIIKDVNEYSNTACWWNSKFGIYFFLILLETLKFNSCSGTSNWSNFKVYMHSHWLKKILFKWLRWLKESPIRWTLDSAYNCPGVATISVCDWHRLVCTCRTCDGTTMF